MCLFSHLNCWICSTVTLVSWCWELELWVLLGWRQSPSGTCPWPGPAWRSPLSHWSSNTPGQPFKFEMSAAVGFRILYLLSNNDSRSMLLQPFLLIFNYFHFFYVIAISNYLSFKSCLEEMADHNIGSIICCCVSSCDFPLLPISSSHDVLIPFILSCTKGKGKVNRCQAHGRSNICLALPFLAL